MSQKLKEDMELVLSYWIRTNFAQSSANMSMRDVMQIMLAFYDGVEVLQFSETLKSPALVLSDNNQCVTNPDTSHRYIVVNIEPATSGIHCWRASINKARDQHAWLLVGVSEKKVCPDTSYTHAYGMAAGNFYPKDEKQPYGSQYWKHHNQVDTEHFNQFQLEVDILLNVDECTLDLCVVDQCADSKIVKFTNLAQAAYVPHFNLFARDNSVRIAYIPAEWFGRSTSTPIF